MKKITGLILICLGMGCLVVFGFRTSAVRPEHRYVKTEPVSSPLLEAALSYIETKPEYRSRYYAEGYPDDQYGTCTDVIGFALQECGYDLRTRVNEDILSHPMRYEVPVPDIDIDFRRVRNLKVYFAYNETVCTTDLSDTEEWKAGDIVIFQDHIGMISDRRNAAGIPYVIHHSGPFQLCYEEDILSSRNDLCMHIRVGL